MRSYAVSLSQLREQSPKFSYKPAKAGNNANDAVVATRVLNNGDEMLIDYRLRGSDDGLSAVRSLRNLIPELPALLISGDTDPTEIARLSASGQDVLAKPFRSERLLERLHSLHGPAAAAA